MEKEKKIIYHPDTNPSGYYGVRIIIRPKHGLRSDEYDRVIHVLTKYFGDYEYSFTMEDNNEGNPRSRHFDGVVLYKRDKQRKNGNIQRVIMDQLFHVNPKSKYGYFSPEIQRHDNEFGPRTVKVVSIENKNQDVDFMFCLGYHLKETKYSPEEGRHRYFVDNPKNFYVSAAVKNVTEKKPTTIFTASLCLKAISFFQNTKKNDRSKKRKYEDCVFVSKTNWDIIIYNYCMEKNIRSSSKALHQMSMNDRYWFPFLPPNCRKRMLDDRLKKAKFTQQEAYDKYFRDALASDYS